VMKVCFSRLVADAILITSLVDLLTT